MTPFRLMAKAWAYYREYGFRDSVHRIHRRRKFIVYWKTLHAPAPALEDEFCFRLATERDVPVLCEVLRGYWGKDPEAEIRERLASGDKAIVGFLDRDEPQAVYVSWLSSRDWLYYALFQAECNSGNICSRRIWVPPPMRRRGLARRGLQFAESVAAQHGPRRLWAFVLSRNKGSRKLHERLGYEQYGVIRLGRFFGKRFTELKRPDQRGWIALTPHEPDGSDQQDNL